MPRKKNPQNLYWNQAVEEAVCGYNSATTQSEREKNYRIIYPALCKVAEVIYHKVKFSYSDDNMQDTMADCVIHLTENLCKFKCGVGTKSFSYFTVCARFFYIQLANKNYRYFQKTIPISMMTDNWDVENTESRDEEKLENARLFHTFLDYCELHAHNIWKPTQLKYALELISLLKSFEELETLNRRDILNKACFAFEEGNRVAVTKMANELTAQYSLFKERFYNDDYSMDYIHKDYLTDDEKEYIIKNAIPGKQIHGYKAMARRFGVNIGVIREFVKTI